MKKNKILTYLLSGVFAMGLICGGAAFAAPRTSARAEEAFDENDIVLTFTNMSDTHIGFGSSDAMLRNALTVAKSFAPDGIDALLFCGDQTQDGKEEQAKLFVSILEEQFDLTETAAIITHGNHDTYWTGCMTTAQFAEAYGETVYTFDADDTDYTTGNRHVEVNGYHFLSVQIMSYTGQNFTNPVSAATESWLKGMLDKLTQENPNQYVFVSCHCPAPDTVYGSMSDQDAGPWGASKELNAILKDYPQVVLFSGHTHYAINDERTINQSTYTQVQSGSVSDLDVEKGYLESGNVPLSGGIANRRAQSQGELIEVDGAGRIRITRIDFARAKQIKDYWYLDACSADGSHLGRYTTETRVAANTAPAFAEDAEAEVIELSQSSVKITYPVAQDDDMVYSYTVAILDANGSELTSVKTLSPWYLYPDLSDLPRTRTLELDFPIAYPYTVKITAYDSFGGESAPLTVTVEDRTEEEKAAAEALDERIRALSAASLTEEDGEEIASIRAAVNALSYKGKGFLTEYDAFTVIEATYYNQFRLTADAASYAPSAEDTYSIAATSSKGWTEESDYTGVSFRWASTTKNNSLGFTQAYSLDGLHISFANLNITSDNRVLALIISNEMKDKWLSGETLLIYIDFSSGEIYVNDGVYVGKSGALVYSDLGATPFDLCFALGEDGGMTMTVHTVFGEETFAVAADQLSGIPHLTDLTQCYVSFTPWESRTTASFDVVAIHDGTDECLEYVSEDPEDPEDPEEPEDPEDPEDPDDPKETGSGCAGCGTVGFGGGWGGGLALAIVAASAAAVCLLRGKRREE